MKKNLLLLVIFGLILCGCEHYSTQSSATQQNSLITFPREGEDFHQGQKLTILAEIQSVEEIERVEFYINNELVNTDNESPYEYIWDTSGYNGGCAIELHAVNRNIGFDIAEMNFINVNSASNFWCSVPAGPFTWGKDDIVRYVNYDYEIMKYDVTTSEFVTYLQNAYDEGKIWIQNSDIYGHYVGDEYNSEGDYSYFDLNDCDSKISWNGQNFSNEEDYDNIPVTEVTWFGADAYAKYYGWRLPNILEWEKAARGMTGYEYPWGDEINGDRANFLNSGDPWDNEATPVGYFNGENETIDSPSPYGCYDMCGNVTNWTATWDLDRPNYRLKGGGGAWNCDTDQGYLYIWKLSSNLTTSAHENRGFRCVRD